MIVLKLKGKKGIIIIEKEMLEKIKIELNTLKKWGNDSDIDIDVSLNDESDNYFNRFTSRNASRSVFFKNNGDANLFKEAKKNNKKQISYNINYNLLNNDFNVEMNIKQNDFRYSNNNIVVNLQDNIVIKELNNFEIIEVINMDTKKVKIERPYDDEYNYSLIYEMILNNDDSLEEAKIEMKTYKANGKVNGTYRLTANNEDGINMQFISRKGKIINMLPISLSLNDICNHDIVASLFNAFTQIFPAEEYRIYIDKSDFSLGKIQEIDNCIINELKGIKGELILPSLSQRINKYLKQVDKHKKNLVKSKLKNNR